MDVFEGLAYLTDLNDSAVVKLNTYDTMHTEPKIRTMSGLGPIKVVHRLKQPISKSEIVYLYYISREVKKLNTFFFFNSY